MSALAEKLKTAGADTVGARLVTACVQELRQGQRSPARVWRQVGETFGYDLVCGLMKDMGLVVEAVSPPTPVRPLLAPERLAKRRNLREIVRSKYKNSAGVSWSDVGWHELPALCRDGGEAAALLAHGPAAAPNDGRTVGQVLGVREVDRIVRAARDETAEVKR